MSTKKKAAKSAKKTAPKKAASTKGRNSSFSGKKITKLSHENPRREGTHGHKSFAAIKNGMTYEAYIAAGGRRNDLAYDVAHKYVKVA
jgi:hypothetical protein